MNSAMGPVAAVVLAMFVTGYIVQSRLPPPKPKIIGIDLGTTFSCVGSYQSISGNITIFEDMDGARSIPSVVYFTNGIQEAVGEYDARNATRSPGAVVYDGKRFIGKSYTVDSISDLQQLYPFKLSLKSDGDVRFDVPVNRSLHSFSPIEIAAFVLKKLKSIAERHIGSAIGQAVISVPAEFNARQRNATIEAGRLAGLKVLRLINEPTAAAMAYGLHKRPGSHVIMVVDFGGGTLDVSLLSVQGGMFVTMAIAGNNRFGGQDVNENILRYVEKIIQKQYGLDTIDPQTLQDLNAIVEATKLNLTTYDNAVISLRLDAYQVGHVFKLPMSRELFNLINKPLFDKLLYPVKRVLQETELSQSDVDDVVLVGGSTRIPKVRSIIEEYFQKKPNVAIDPDIAVVTGVALQAGIMGGMWPLQVAAIEMPTTNMKKIDLTNH